MIAVHRITNPDHTFLLNPDLIQMVEANPDTVISLTNGSRHVVIESPAEVARLVRDWRAGVLIAALSAPETTGHPHVAEALGQLLQFPQKPL